MNVRLIAIDLDDTLLKADLSISAANRQTLKAAGAAGIEIVLASGRNYLSMSEYAAMLGLDRKGNYLICSNGAEIIEADTGPVVGQLRFSPQTSLEIASDIEAHGFPWQVYNDGKIICSKPTIWAMRDKHLTGQPLVVSSGKEETFEKGEVKFVIPGEPEKIATLYAEFAEKYSGKAEIMTSKPYFLEILPLGANKGAALARLASHLGISMEEVMAIGDAMNDLSMIESVGFGCAPANALPEVKARARIISRLTNEEDAVADLIGSVALGNTSRERE
ncbi:MAG: Cof-type HAD-IIB family hydrolase [Spirochaetaceae bacterium]|nr:Cof-type HAD-IIB family hydrolase [Spirochaetaceae bacterium]